MSLLAVEHLAAFYGDFQALFDVSLAVGAGETVAVIGANGAGKSTFLKAIAGLLPAPAEAVRLDARPVGGRPAWDLVGRGVVMVPEGRRIFPSLTVEENLKIGAYCRRPGPWTIDRVYALFPNVAERSRQPGTTLSGGEQQMLAIGRALMANPRLLLLDEISLGLAPLVVKRIYAALEQITAAGATALIVEQDVSQVLEVADRVYCFQKGRVTLEGRPADLTRERISAAYFGL
jgi:branched-chain amino acid transport system ATP-binding protein